MNAANKTCQTPGSVDSRSSNRNNQINIADLEKTYEDAFKKWWEEDEPGVKDMLLRGKVLSIKIAEARKSKYQYVSFRDFRINISTNTRLISQQDLTKTRFFTLLHRFIHKQYQQETDESKKDSYEVSALVMKVNFTPDFCLTPIRFLLGTGFQHQHDIVIKDKSSVVDKVAFVIGCMVLDWLSGRAEKSPRKVITEKYGCFKDYALSEDAHSGEVLSAGSRGMKDKELTFLRDEVSVNIFSKALDQISFDMRRNVSNQRCQKALKSFFENLSSIVKPPNNEQIN